MTTKTFKIQTTITASLVVDYDYFERDMKLVREWAATEEREKDIHPMTLKMVRDGKTNEEILEMVAKHAVTKLFKDELKENSDIHAEMYFKGFEVITKVSE